MLARNRPALFVAILLAICSINGCSVLNLADATVNMAATTVKVGANAVGVASDAVRVGANAVVVASDAAEVVANATRTTLRAVTSSNNQQQ